MSLALADTVTVIFITRILLTPIKGCTALIKGIFFGGAQGLWYGQFFVLLSSCTARLLHQQQVVDSSYFVIKRGFLRVYITKRG